MSVSISVRNITLSGIAALILGCSGAPKLPEARHISIPVTPGWYDHERVYYITTEITDPPMAQAGGVTLAPRLVDAIPPYPKPPAEKDVLERVYKFPNGEQDAVFASVPNPIGPKSLDAQYSPLWLLYVVHWTRANPVMPLTSEEAVLSAEGRGDVTITRTQIVINCPIVATERGGLMPGTTLSR